MPEAAPDTPAMAMARAFLGPEAFPLFYNVGNPFMLNGERSGALNARARCTFELNNWPHVAFGLRIVNVYAVPDGFSAEDVPLFNAMKLWMDEDQEVSFTLAQQNVIATPLHQATLTGRGGQHWHPFPKPYLFRGANQARVEVTRLTAYPQLVQEDVLPVCRCTLVTAVLVTDAAGRTRAAPGSTGRP